MSDKIKSSYSRWNLFRNCRKAVYWRYVRALEKTGKTEFPLSFGLLIHECLELWHAGEPLDSIMSHVRRQTGSMPHEDGLKAYTMGTSMIAGYTRAYPVESFQVVSLEQAFSGPIGNPESGANSRSFILEGRVDGLVKNTDTEEYYVLEHKTAARLDGSYLEKLWCDFQTTLYAYYLEQAMGIRISGVIYNVLVKSQIRRGKKETADEFQERMDAAYLKPEMFHREELIISRDRYEELRAELWELTQQYLDCQRREVWSQNTSYCFQWNKPCEFFPLCRSGGSEIVAETLYQPRTRREEAKKEPVF